MGHPEHNPVELHAPQAYFDKPLHFANGPGFANDWLTGWTDANAKIWFEIEAVAAGDYEIELSFACPPADAGSRVRVRLGSESLEAIVRAALATEIKLPHRDEKGKTTYRNREWGTLQFGTLKISKGPGKLTLESLAMLGTQVMEVKQLKLTKKTAK